MLKINTKSIYSNLYYTIFIYFMIYFYINYSNTSLYKFILNPLKVDNEIYVFSSILDNNSVIRIIAFSNSLINKNINCKFNKNGKIITRSSIEHYTAVHESYYNIICRKPHESIAAYFYLSNLVLYPFNNNENNELKYNLLFCLTTFFSFNYTKRFIEFIEYYKYFGVDKFIVYNTNCSKQIEKRLLYYKNNGIMDIIYDNFTHNIYERKRFHVWKQNDCYHRYKYYAKRIIFTDHDEIIYSPKHKTSSNLFSHLNKLAASYHFYPKLTITNGLGFFTKGYYSICPHDYWKFIINNYKCISQVIVHDVLLINNRRCFKVKVSIDDGFVLHARNQPSRHSKKCKDWKYVDSFENDSNYLKKTIKKFTPLFF